MITITGPHVNAWGTSLPMETNMEVVLKTVLVFILLTVSCLGQITKEMKAEMLRNAEECNKKHGTNQMKVMQVLASSTDDQPSKCFLYCMMEKYALMKDNKISDVALNKMLQKIPDQRMKESIEKHVKPCEQQSSGNKCEMAYKIIKCIYEKYKPEQS